MNPVSSDGVSQGAGESLRLHMINVGYGDAFLLEFPGGKTMVIDAGEKPAAPGFMDYLRGQRIHKIDYAVITHPHANHFEGFAGMFGNFEFGQVFINGDSRADKGYRELLEKFEAQGVAIRVLKRGDRIEGIDEHVLIEVLHPGDLTDSVNGNSIVLWLEHKDVRMVLMGDIGPHEQDEVIGFFDKVRTADLVKVPHHGGPLSGEFPKVFAKGVKLISTGPNSWGWSFEKDIQALEGDVYRTDRDGTVVIESDGEGVTVHQHKIK